MLEVKRSITFFPPIADKNENEYENNYPNKITKETRLGIISGKFYKEDGYDDDYRNHGYNHPHFKLSLTHFALI